MIGLTGPHRTGKSTLAQAFAELHKIPFVATSASEVFAKAGLDPKEDYPFEVRLMMQELILSTFEVQYRHAQAKSHFFIADRTPIDLASYLLADVARQTTAHRPELSHLATKYVQECFSIASRYFSVIVLVQPGIRLVEQTGKAPACPAYMEHLNAIQMGLLVDQRNLSRRFFMPRHITNLDERLAALAGSVKAMIDADERMRDERLVH